MRSLTILTGASGSGKTAVLQYLTAHAPPLTLFHFDSIGVPAYEIMIRDFGSGENWQRLKTNEWINRLAQEAALSGDVLLEGQMRIAFIQEALTEAKLTARIVLLDCSDAERSRRLTVLRQQPELDSADMRNWAAYLRAEAVQAGVAIVDTSRLSIAEAARSVLD